MENKESVEMDQTEENLEGQKCLNKQDDKDFKMEWKAIKEPKAVQPLHQINTEIGLQ